MPQPEENPVARIAELLSEVGAATLRADFAALDRLGDALEASLDADPAALANALAQDPRSLERAREAARRNLALLDAARRGLTDARNRIAEIERARAGVVTYAPDGKRAIEATAAPRTIRRA
jgi:hypothetical protein